MVHVWPTERQNGLGLDLMQMRAQNISTTSLAAKFEIYKSVKIHLGHFEPKRAPSAQSGPWTIFQWVQNE